MYLWLILIVVIICSSFLKILLLSSLCFLSFVIFGGIFNFDLFSLLCSVFPLGVFGLLFLELAGIMIEFSDCCQSSGRNSVYWFMFDINLHLLLLTDEVDEILWYVVNAIDGIEGP